MKGGSLHGNTAWKEYSTKYPERAEFFERVLRILHRGKQVLAKENPNEPMDLCYFADGTCDLVSIAVLQMIDREKKPWKFTWVPGRVQGTSHIFLHDTDADVYIDLTARQFFPEKEMETVAGSAEELRALGYIFPYEEHEFMRHIFTVIKEVDTMLNKGIQSIRVGNHNESK